MYDKYVNADNMQMRVYIVCVYIYIHSKIYNACSVCACLRVCVCVCARAWVCVCVRGLRGGRATGGWPDGQAGGPVGWWVGRWVGRGTFLLEKLQARLRSYNKKQ